MARRIPAAKYEAYITTQFFRPLIPCYYKDAKEIYHKAPPVEEEEEKPAESSSAPPASFAPAEGASPPAVVLLASSGLVAAVADKVVQAVDIV